MEDWLRSIGLGERIAAFRAQQITLDLVADLTDEDLSELGLTIGERKRFRRAAAALAAAPVVERIRAERRPLTIMFIDLVDSSALGEQLEAEDLLEVIRRYREFAGAWITRFGGHIARLIGDGILAYFCYPAATENDPERAVRAALEIAEGLGAIATPADRPLAVRIGIATGRVIVSDLFAGGEPDLRSIIGSTPNLAARLQGFAPAGGIVIADETYARVGRVVVCEDMGRREIRGFAQQHHIWRVIGLATPAAQEGAARVRRQLTPYYGRQAELGVLAERWSRVRAGGNATVLVAGEAGIGKSRLVEQFLAVHVSADEQVVRLYASALDEDSALHPVFSFLHRAAGLVPGEPPAASLARLESVLKGDGARREAALPVLAELARIAWEDPTILGLTPAQLRERMLSVLTEQLLLRTRERPLCLVVEDLHWLDPTSRELLGRLVAASEDHPALLLLTARVGFEAPWLARRDTTVLRLVPLSPDDVAGMVQSLFTDRELPERLARLIAQRTDGVPLFVEEVARSLLADDRLEDPGELGTAMPDQAIPASLHESLMARLDRSGVAKGIAQIAAVIGRSARRDVLAAVAGLPETELEPPLAALAEAGVLFPGEGGGRYRFSHALLRDAAYDSLLRDDRHRLHLAVARALADREPDLVAQQPELLAMHLTEGEEPEEAAPYWLEAGQRALARSALTEATRLLRRGLAALEQRPAEPPAVDHRLALSALLGPALIALKGPASPEAQDLYGRAYALRDQLPENTARFPLIWGWWRVARAFDVKKHRAETLLARALARDDPGLLLQAHHCNWATHYDLGDFDRCSRHITLGLGLYRQGEFRHHARLYGNHDALVCGLGALAQVEWMRGRPLRGLAHEDEGRRWAAEMQHVGTHAHALDVTILHHAHRRDHRMVFELAAEQVRFTSEHGMTDHRAKGLIFGGWAKAMQDDAAAGLGMLEEGLARQREIGTLEDFPVYVCLHAEALSRAGRPERAIEELRRDRVAFAEAGLGFWMPEVLRTEAAVTLEADPASTSAAEALLDEAARLAESQGVPMLGLRIAVTAAGLELVRGEREVASRRVAAALSRIAEDDAGADLAAARALLERLPAGP